MHPCGAWCLVKETIVDIEEEIAEGHRLIATWPEIEKAAVVGSALYLGEANDVDFVVLLGKGFDLLEFQDRLKALAWEKCGEYDTGPDFTWTAVRKENLNWMLTTSPTFFAGYVTAMEVCRGLNLQTKADRIMVCRIVRDGMTATEACIAMKQMGEL